MIARGPHDRGEPLAEGAEGPFDVRGQLPDIAGQQQPVLLRVRAEIGDDLAVLREGDVEVAEGEQPGRDYTCLRSWQN
jgi:hypothetical protein